MTADEFNTLVSQAAAAAQAYYDTDTQIMTDAEYDALIEQIETALAENPALNNDFATALLTKVAAGSSGGGNVTHTTPMLSLGKVKEMTDVEDFINKTATAVIVEPKMDGMAVSAKYVNGNLTLVATRGDGTTGEDVTAQAANINGLPQTLAKPVTLEVRGEVYMTDNDFITASANRVAAGKQAFANARNATAGTLRNADLSYIAPMSFAAYDANGAPVDSIDSYLTRMAAVRKLGVAVACTLIPGGTTLLTTFTDVETQINAIHNARLTLGFPIDGAVIKADSISVRDSLGAASRHPRWAAAYKYPADTTTSTLRDIEVTVGRTGRIGLRGIIDPVNIDGTTITYASLHNIPWVEASGILINGTVTVYRAGDVIPRITAPAGLAQPTNAYKWTAPTTCPQCDEPLDTSSLLYRCTTPECSIVGRIEYAASRDCLDIEGLGIEVADALVESGLVNNIADLFDLTVPQIANIQLGVTDSGNPRLIGSTVAAKIHNQIEAAKNQPFNRVITALGIRKTGRTMGRRLAARFHTMTALRDATIEDLCTVEGIARDKAEYIHTGLTEMAEIIDRLTAAGVNMGEEPANTGTLPLAGQTYVVSGSVPGYTRTTIAEAIEALGGTASSSVSKNTTALVTSETSTSKAVKAAQLGIPIIDPNEFAATLKAHGR